MKRVFFAFLALMLCINASAFEFDGIDLNGSILSITRNISLRGYVNDNATHSLKGKCQGKEIYLSFNLEDVTQKGKLGQLIVDVPMSQSDALDVVTETFNVIYHQIDAVNGHTAYLVDNDGTIVTIEKSKMGIRYIYSTPYYKAK